MHCEYGEERDIYQNIILSTRIRDIQPTHNESKLHIGDRKNIQTLRESREYLTIYQVSQILS